MIIRPTPRHAFGAAMLLGLFTLFLASSVLQHSSATQLPSPSIYDVLRAHGLPIGLLPKGVKDFQLDEAGRFEAHLDQACNAQFESQLHYDRNVSGTISYGQIGALSGITAQELFLWFPVKEIRVDIPSSGIIYFDVGVVFKQFSLSLFETPPVCTVVRSDELSGFHDGASMMSQLFSKVESKVLKNQIGVE